MANPTTILKSEEGCLFDLHPSAARTVDGVGDEQSGANFYSGFNATLAVTAASGTSPTLNVYIQMKLANDSWMDIVSFPQLTGVATRMISFTGGGNTFYTPTDATLAASTVLAVALGGWIRVKWDIGGTGPSFTFQLALEMIR